MLKTSLLVAAGLAAGLVIAFWLQPSPEPRAATAGGSMPVVRSAADSGAAVARLAALEDAFAAEVEHRVALEARVVELATQIEATGERPRSAAEGGERPNGEPDAAAIQQMRAGFRDGGASRAAIERRMVEQLIAGGFAPDRADWINRRSQELRMQTLQAQYDATREGRAIEPGIILGNDGMLRAELGDTDYERYLMALGRPTAVGVRNVLASSPAESSGLQPGDEIVAYDGQRVFDMRELNALTLEGTPGESVVVDVRRADQNVQLVMPRGPIGIFGGGFRGR
jgi:hypothetical protein